MGGYALLKVIQFLDHIWPLDFHRAVACHLMSIS